MRTRTGPTSITSAVPRIQRPFAAKVRETGADAGIAFDGDGDRVVMVDADGQVVDGDEMLYIIAKTGLPKGRLTGGVVGTVMSNLGLEQALETCGIPFERAAVGDRYVLERMRARGWQLGGESSGHLICLALTTTGDGIVSALQVLVAMVESARSLAELPQRDAQAAPNHGECTHAQPGRHCRQPRTWRCGSRHRSQHERARPRGCPAEWHGAGGAGHG